MFRERITKAGFAQFVPTSLVGENGIAGREKVISGRKKSWLEEKCIVLIMTQFNQKIMVTALYSMLPLNFK